MWSFCLLERFTLAVVNEWSVVWLLLELPKVFGRLLNLNTKETAHASLVMV
jgi:hypothetical protein